MSSMWKLSGLTWRELSKRVWHQFREDRVLDQSAKLSFYFLLSIFPLLLFLIALLGLLLQSGPTRYVLLHKYLTAVAPESASSLLDTTLRQITLGSGALKVFLALVFTLWTASQGMVAIIEGLNIAYEAREARPWWKKRLIALGLTVVSVVLTASVLLLLIFGDRFAEITMRQLGFSNLISGVWNVIEWGLALAFVLLTLNVLYIFAPNVRHRRWQWLMPGTVVGVALWLLVSFGFKLYLTFFNRFALAYGSIGAVIILLLWLYLSGIAILVGGEVNSEIEKASSENRPVEHT